MGRPPASSVKVPTTERILRAAEVEFAAYGFTRARLEDIAAEAGIRRPAILYHFKTKEVLYEATVERAYREWTTAMGAVIGRSTDFEDGLERLVCGFWAYVNDRPTVARLALHEIVLGDGGGRAVFLAQVLPLVDLATHFVRSHTGPTLPSGAPVRAGVLQVVADMMLRVASGELQETLWGPEHGVWILARNTMLGAPPT